MHFGQELTIEDITIILKKGYPTTYIIDGIKNDASILDIPVRKIEGLQFNEFHYQKFDKNEKFLKITP